MNVLGCGSSCSVWVWNKTISSASAVYYIKLNYINTYNISFLYQVIQIFQAVPERLIMLPAPTKALCGPCNPVTSSFQPSLIQVDGSFCQLNSRLDFSNRKYLWGIQKPEKRKQKVYHCTYINVQVKDFAMTSECFSVKIF